MCPLRDFQHALLLCSPTICPQLSPYLSSLTSFLSLPFFFPLQDHVSVTNCLLLFPLPSLSLSHTAKCKSIPLPSCFCLAWPLFTLSWALASLQPYTLHLICLVSLTSSSSHACCSFALLAEMHFHFCNDLVPLHSTQPAPFSSWLCWAARSTWKSFCFSLVPSHSAYMILVSSFIPSLCSFPHFPTLPSSSLSSLLNISVTHWLSRPFHFDLHVLGKQSFVCFMHEVGNTRKFSVSGNKKLFFRC